MVMVRRVRAGNASAMTGTGTNSYIVGQGRVAVIDPGPLDLAHLQALMAALGPHERVEAILVTHAHLDHSALASSLAEATGAPVMAFGGATSGRSARMQRLVAEGLTGGGEGTDLGFTPDRFIADGTSVQVGEFEIEALHTPGHMGGHMCFACEGLLFSGDHAMGWASSLISPPDGDMGAYMASLSRLSKRDWHQMFPGHGEVVDTPAHRLAELTAHRKQREAEILTALHLGPATAAGLAAQIYRDTPTELLPAAVRNVLAHLIDLIDRNAVLPLGRLNAGSVFQLT